MSSTINKEWIYDQPPQEVWEYLTKPELLALWLMPNNFKAVQGHEFQFRTKPLPSENLDGVFHCKVIDIRSLELLVYSWKGGPGDGTFTLNTLVEWQLEPLGKGTKLLLTHSGFTQHNSSILAGMTDGWEKKLQKVLTLLNEAK
jgi:uncharacterized protein YndB with AHSA1/START domain